MHANLHSMEDSEEGELVKAPLVIVDTSVMRKAGRQLDSNGWQVLEHFAEVGLIRVAIPEVVLDEFVAHHRDSAVDHLNKLKGAFNCLQSIDSSLPDLPQIDLDETMARFRAHISEHIQDYAEVIALPSVSHEVIVRRLCERKKPTGKDGERGYRDSLIWHTLLELAHENLELLLLSDNYRDFGDGSGIAAELADELPNGVSVKLVRDITALGDILGGHPTEFVDAAIGRVQSDRNDINRSLGRLLVKALAIEDSQPEENYRLDALEFRLGGVSQGPEDDSDHLNIGGTAVVRSKGEHWLVVFEGSGIFERSSQQIDRWQVEPLARIQRRNPAPPQRTPTSNLLQQMNLDLGKFLAVPFEQMDLGIDTAGHLAEIDEILSRQVNIPTDMDLGIDTADPTGREEE